MKKLLKSSFIFLHERRYLLFFLFVILISGLGWWNHYSVNRNIEKSYNEAFNGVFPIISLNVLEKTNVDSANQSHPEGDHNSTLAISQHKLDKLQLDLEMSRKSTFDSNTITFLITLIFALLAGYFIQSQEKVSTQMKDVSAKMTEVSTQMAEVSRQKDEVSTQISEVSKQKGEASAQMAEVSKQKDEVSVQMAEVSKQKDEVSAQMAEVSKQKDNILAQMAEASERIKKIDEYTKKFKELLDVSVQENIIFYNLQSIYSASINIESILADQQYKITKPILTLIYHIDCRINDLKSNMPTNINLKTKTLLVEFITNSMQSFEIREIKKIKENEELIRPMEGTYNELSELKSKIWSLKEISS